MHRRRFLRFALVVGGFSPLIAAGQASSPSTPAPALLLANSYRPGLVLTDYWVSEKYDGVRGYWTGTQLRTRGGEIVQAPAWFTQDWPAEPMDGELWAGRNKFSHAQSTVRQHQPSDAAWRQMRFMVFDLPTQPGSFDERLPVLQTTIARIGQAWVEAVPQHRVASEEALRALLLRTVRAGGEGLMLHRGSAPYRSGRSDDLIKLKTHDDAEARVVAHLPGKGRHAGHLGALLVETPQGQRFRLGTGFSDADRRDPPPVGAWVTYRFRGTHDSGLPRFASYLRVREDMPPLPAAARH